MDIDETDPSAEKATKDVKRRRTGDAPANPAGPRPPPVPTNIELDPPCDRCRRKHERCVEQLGPDDEDDGKTKKKRTACYECAKVRSGCTQQGLGARSGQKRKTPAMVEHSEEDELPDGEWRNPRCHAGLNG